MNDNVLEHLTKVFWPEGDSLTGNQVYWLLDGAQDPEIADLLRRGGLEFTCLFEGNLHPRLRAAAPYLVHLSAGSSTTELLLRKGWGKAWGILTIARPEITLTQQRLHFKKLLRVQTEDGEVFGFRFYDPRVLREYLPTCKSDEIKTLFGPVTRLLAESHDGSIVHAFKQGSQGLGVRDHPVAGLRTRP